jgi:hypothetical protein
VSYDTIQKDFFTTTFLGVWKITLKSSKDYGHLWIGVDITWWDLSRNITTLLMFFYGTTFDVIVFWEKQKATTISISFFRGGIPTDRTDSVRNWINLTHWDYCYYNLYFFFLEVAMDESGTFRSEWIGSIWFSKIIIISVVGSDRVSSHLVLGYFRFWVVSGRVESGQLSGHFGFQVVLGRVKSVIGSSSVRSFWISDCIKSGRVNYRVI